MYLVLKLRLKLFLTCVDSLVLILCSDDGGRLCGAFALLTVGCVNFSVDSTLSKLFTSAATANTEYYTYEKQHH